MSPVDYILDGLKAELELERELGIRFVEFDRTNLQPPTSNLQPPTSKLQTSNSKLSPSNSNSHSNSLYDFVFVHHRPLSPDGIAMMAKIILAMGRTEKTAPVIVAPPLPKAKVYIVLGAFALRQYFPSIKAEPGPMMLVAEGGEKVIVTYSPEYILRFKTVTPMLKKIKLDMWQAIKGVLKRI